MVFKTITLKLIYFITKLTTLKQNLNFRTKTYMDYEF